MKQTKNDHVMFTTKDIAHIKGLKTHGERVYECALLYARAGIYTIPIRPNGKETPESRYGVDYTDATISEATVSKWFHPANGMFKDANIGFACGRSDSLLVLDVDMHGDKNGYDTLNELDPENEVAETLSALTPSGGAHYFYPWEEHAISSNDKLGVGIDTRGGKGEKFSSHVVVYPSCINGKHYEWNQVCDMYVAPKWLMDGLGKAWNQHRPASTTSRGNENIDDGDCEEVLGADQIVRMLEAVSPDELSYEDWLRIGQAINTQYPDESGLYIWDEWSQRGVRYEKKECQIRWRGFDPAGPVRVGSLFYFAKASGWVAQDGDNVKTSGKHDELVERMNETFAVVVVSGHTRILRRKDIVADSTFTHYDLLGVADFKVMLDNDLVWEPGAEKPQKAANLWLSHQARRTYANGMAMFPDNKPHDGYFNTWAGLSMNPAEGDCSLILQHIHKVICDSDDEIYEWVMDWCADMVQDPGNPKGCALILKGQEGTGKGMFAEMMAAYFGAHYRHIIDESHYTGNFNAHMMDAVFVFLDEVTFGGNIKTSGKIKGLVSEKVLLGERKGIDAVTYRNMAHVLIASNEKWVIPAGSNSRRWTVLEVNPDRATDIDYFKDLRHQMDNGGLEAFLFVLLGRELKENIRTAPHTVALQEQRDLSASSDSISQFWIYCVETDMQCLNNNACEANVKDEPSNIAKVDLYREYKDFCDSHTLRAVQLIPFCSEAKKIGFIEVRFTVNKNRIRGYAMPTPRAFAMAIGHYEEVL